MDSFVARKQDTQTMVHRERHTGETASTVAEKTETVERFTGERDVDEGNKGDG